MATVPRLTIAPATPSASTTSSSSVIVPMFYRDRRAFMRAMLRAIALNGSFFNTQRMVQQYVLKAYL